MPAASALIGETVGSWRIERLLAEGGMGRVYLGVHPAMGGRVAIKVLTGDAAEDPVLVERFFAEARAVNLIHHEHIVDIVDLARLPDGRPYIVMEYLAGASLAAVLERHGPLPLGTLARLMAEVLDALEAAHAKGVVHRDLKPDNIFVTPSGHAKVLDFGIAKLAPDDGATAVKTKTGYLLGTPPYMSPEQCAEQPVDARSDLYTVGVILFEAATGTRPFRGGSTYDLLRQHIQAPPPSPRALREDLPPAFEAVILRALAKAPAWRFASATELREALLAAVAELPAEASQPIAIVDAAPPPVVEAPPTRPLRARDDTPATKLLPAGASPLARLPGAPKPERARPPLALYAMAAVAAGFGALALFGGGGSSSSVPLDAAVSCADDPVACDQRAWTLAQGDGAASAAVLLEEACTAGAARGCSHLGSLLADGRGVERDALRALDLQERACRAGEPSACVEAGLLLLRTVDEPDAQRVPQPDVALARFATACDGAEPRGCLEQGQLLETQGDPANAYLAYRRGCELGLADACFDEGVFLLDGRGVGAEPVRAAERFASACDAAVPRACGALGQLYAYGKGVPKDPLRAASLYDQACAHGVGAACFNLGSMAELGRSIPADPTRAAAAFTRACELGIPDGCDGAARVRSGP